MKIGLSACSNGHIADWMPELDKLEDVLTGMGIEAVRAPHILDKTDKFSGTDEERAEDLMSFFRDDSIDAICDISGGDLANGVLKYLDFDEIAKAEKMFWGYSDLTTVINSIYAKTGNASALYQIKNLVWSKAELQQQRFKDYVEGKNQDLFDIEYKFLQGDSMEGVVVGGNIRCLTKLAGTEFWPDMEGKILLLESLSGTCAPMATLLTQLDLMGVFDKVSGVLLGTFTEYEKSDMELSIFDLLKMHISENLPVAKTSEIGHGHNSKAIVIGQKRHFG